MRRSLSYLCLQATREGQASYGHVHQIIGGLERLGWDCRLFEPLYAGSSRTVGLHRKLIEYIRVQAACAASLGRTSILYVRDHPASSPTLFAARFARVPVVLEVNGPPDELGLSFPALRPLGRVLVALFLRRCHSARAIITVTPELKQWIVARGVEASKIRTVGNGADPDHFTPAVESASRPYAVFFGALAVWQGVDAMIRAVASPHWPRDVDLWIAGDGVERPRVLAAAATSESIRYLGTVPYDTIPSVVNSALVSLIMKNDLGDRSATGLSPLKLYESMAAGVPVIVSDLPGLSDVVSRCECGIVVPVDDSDALAAAVAEIAGSAEDARLMGRRAREAAVAQYSWAAAARRTHEVLLHCLEGPVTDAD